MINDFFRINLPYGIGCNKNGEWMAFNREYMPLGYNDISLKRGGHPRDSFNELPIYTKYRKFTDKFLLSLADDEKSITRDADGKIVTVYLYSDKTVPVTLKNDINLWNRYFDKIRKLSELEQIRI
jgi:hypothetical protein